MWTSLTLGLLILFLIPTRIFGSFFGSYRTLFNHFYEVGLVVFIFAAFAFALLHNLVAPEIKSNREPSSPRFRNAAFPATPVWVVRLQKLNYLLAGIILLKVLFSLGTPLDIDENIHAREAAEGRIRNELNLLNTDPKAQFLQNHVLPQFFSIVSLKVFGINKFAYRLPAFLFTALLFVALFRLGDFLPPLALTLLLAHWGTNGLAQWYFHSARGYAAMMFFTAVTFLIILGFIKKPSPLSRNRIGLFTAAAVLGCFTHLFAILFNSILIFSFLIWLNLNRSYLAPKTFHRAKTLVFVGLALIPIFAFVLVHHLIFLHRLGDLNSAALPNFSHSLIEVLGFAYSWQAKAFLVTLVAAIFYGFRKRIKFRSDFVTVFLATTLVFFTAAIGALHVRVFEPRFLLAFLLPTILWLGEFIRVPLASRQKALVAAILFVVLALFPRFSSHSIYANLVLNVEDFDHFITETRGLTAPVADNCYSFSGKFDLAAWARDFYFADVTKAKTVNWTCRHSYHLEISPTPDPEKNLNRLPSGNLQMVYQNKDMILYLTE